LEWLDKQKVARFSHHSWSNHFDFSSRFGRYTKDDPIIVWSALIGHAYLDAFEVTGSERFLQIANSVCNWILELPREKTDNGDCISYLAHVQSSVHNANMLGAGFLARTAQHTGSQECREVARSAMEYTCSRQRPDGSWWYAESHEYHWIDNFHTGYNLDALKHYMDATGDKSFRRNFERGLEFYKANFFEKNGRPKYYHTRTYPVDIQCAAQAIDTLASVSDEDPDSLLLANRVAFWTIQNMQDRRGYFYFRQYPLRSREKMSTLSTIRQDFLFSTAVRKPALTRNWRSKPRPILNRRSFGTEAVVFLFTTIAVSSRRRVPAFCGT
jgi:rhamnogalacturonyl hydrolase YesR